MVMCDAWPAWPPKSTRAAWWKKCGGKKGGESAVDKQNLGITLSPIIITVHWKNGWPPFKKQEHVPLNHDFWDQEYPGLIYRWNIWNLSHNCSSFFHAKQPEEVVDANSQGGTLQHMLSAIEFLMIQYKKVLEWWQKSLCGNFIHADGLIFEWLGLDLSAICLIDSINELF